MRIHDDFELQDFHTFHIPVKARRMVWFDEDPDPELVKKWIHSEAPWFILGEGSNVLFVNDFDGNILTFRHKEMRLLEDNADDVLIEVSSGYDWDQLVHETVLNGWGGLENLSWIPGTVGASPVQNIGAYGIEVSDCIEKVKGIDLNTFREEIFMKQECDFAYRSSIFKHHLKGRFLITWVQFRLSKNPVPELGYGPVREKVKGIPNPGIQTLREIVIEIRRAKLPDPDQLGNAGSFFKNPVVKGDVYDCLKDQWPDLPGYALHDHQVKIPAAWLIDQLGWKGYRDGDAGVHDTQALVLVNYGKASGTQIMGLADRIIQSVKERFGILLEPEVNICT